MFFDGRRNAVGSPGTIARSQQFWTRNIALLNVLCLLQQIVVDRFSDDGIFPAGQIKKTKKMRLCNSEADIFS